MVCRTRSETMTIYLFNARTSYNVHRSYADCRYIAFTSNYIHIHFNGLECLFDKCHITHWPNVIVMFAKSIVVDWMRVAECVFDRQTCFCIDKWICGITRRTFIRNSLIRCKWLIKGDFSYQIWFAFVFVKFNSGFSIKMMENEID